MIKLTADNASIVTDRLPESQVTENEVWMTLIICASIVLIVVFSLIGLLIWKRMKILSVVQLEKQKQEKEFSEAQLKRDTAFQEIQMKRKEALQNQLLDAKKSDNSQYQDYLNELLSD